MLDASGAYDIIRTMVGWREEEYKVEANGNGVCHKEKESIGKVFCCNKRCRETYC